MDTNPPQIIEFPLPGNKLQSGSNGLELVAKYGDELYKNNRDFIKERVSDNWFVIIEPSSGTLIASPDQYKLYEYGKGKFPDRLFYSVGLLKENFLYRYA
jgi:hypothetical protein